MPIKRIHIENFKSFSAIDVELSRFCVVIGSNAAGKSNFISAFKFLRDIARHGVVNAIAMQGGADYLRNAKIGNERDLVVQVVYEPDHGEEVMDRTDKGGPMLEVRSCESSYEFALHFHANGEDFPLYATSC
jgi:predicted ATPase